MIVLHANWSRGALHVWGEDVGRFTAALTPSARTAAGTHPFVATVEELRAAIEPALAAARAACADDARVGAPESVTDASLALLLPFAERPAGPLPLPSDRLAALDEAAGFDAEPEEALAPLEVPALAFDARTAFALTRCLADGVEADGTAWGHDARWWGAVSRFAEHLIADQRVIPTVVQERSGAMFAAWRPWLQDAPNHARFLSLVRSVPAVVRAAEGAGAPTAVVEQSMGAFVDATVRDNLESESYADAIDGRDPDR
ncbi:MAG: hypothetical protein ACKOF7_00810, partial [Phycisphaerales bacterium]